jgi:hypothetical protein
VGLSSAQQTCHLFSQHVRIVKKCMTRSDANERSKYSLICLQPNHKEPSY